MRVLVVEDDPDIQVILRMVLTRLGKCEVQATFQGLPVPQMARDFKPSFIMLDVMLPDTSGFEIIKNLKADPDIKDIPVIFLTARSMPGEIQDALNLGAVGYLAKPFDPMALVPQINKLLEPCGLAIGGDA